MKSFLKGRCLFLVFCVVFFTTKFIETAPSVEVQTDGLTTKSYAEQMKSYMNMSADPCEDFYSFACGNYPNVIEDWEQFSRRESLIDMVFVSFDRFDDILKKERDPSEEFYEELQIAKKYVDTCDSAKLFPMQPSQEYLNVIKKIGGFPAIDESWDESSFDWFNMTAHLLRYGIVGLVGEEIVLMHPYPPYYKVPNLGFDFDVYPENIASDNSEGYIYNENVMRDLLQVYSVTGQKADEVIEGIFDLWRTILDLISQIEDKDNLQKSCQELTMKTNGPPKFEKWNSLLEISWNTSVLNDFPLSVCPCDWFFNRLDSIAQKKAKDFANYMALKFLFSLHPRLKSTKFQRRRCVFNVKNAMPLIFSHFFMKEHYHKEYENDVLKIIEDLKSSYNYRINTAAWLDDASRDEALKKLKNIRINIGQVEDPITYVYIKQTRTLHPTDNFDLNNLELAKFKVDMRHYGFLHSNETTNRTAPYGVLDASILKFFFYHVENSLNIMGGALYPPVYDKDFPLSMKFGTLGYIIGHEFGHAFQGTGFRFNSNQKIQLWLSEESFKIAENRTECFIEDYNNYKDPSFNYTFDGKKVKDEVQADSLGLREAFEAFERNKLNSKQRYGIMEETLPGLSMGQDELFFLSMAQLYCSKYEQRHYWDFKSTKHPLNRYRVMGTLRNFEEFSNVFHCPIGSPMNPLNKCRLW